MLDYPHGQEPEPAGYAGASVAVTITGGRRAAQRLATGMVYQPQRDAQCSCPAFSSALLDLGPPPAPVSDQVVISTWRPPAGDMPPTGGGARS
jgi:hypothetical protein